jgi:hypothetical protein
MIEGKESIGLTQRSAKKGQRLMIDIAGLMLLRFVRLESDCECPI